MVGVAAADDTVVAAISPDATMMSVDEATATRKSAFLMVFSCACQSSATRPFSSQSVSFVSCQCQSRWVATRTAPLLWLV